MQRMARSSVLLYGVGGLGIEIGKSLYRWVHKFPSKTLLSNTTLVKKRPKATLGRFFYERSTTLGRKKSTKCITLLFLNKYTQFSSCRSSAVKKPSDRPTVDKLSNLVTGLECI